MTDGLETQLQRLGLSPTEATVYAHLLASGPTTEDEAEAGLDLRPLDISAAFARLIEVGLAGVVGEDGSVAPITPVAGLDMLARERESELRQAQVAASAAFETFKRTVWPQPTAGLIEIVTGTEIRPRIRQIEANATSEILRFDSPPYYTTAFPNEMENANLARGVRYRVVYAKAAMERPGYYEANVQPCIAAGEQARVLPSVPVKLTIVDQRVALVSLSIQQAEVNRSLVIVYPSALLSALTGLFEIAWRAALPMHVGERSPSALLPAERRVLELLAMGLSDEVIAERLGVSRRTLTRHVERLMSKAGVDGRFQLGLVAGKENWL
jgi:DNA-binding NarL/FixJ family response regulator